VEVTLVVDMSVYSAKGLEVAREPIRSLTSQRPPMPVGLDVTGLLEVHA
jgi:hypothetical protein